MLSEARQKKIMEKLKGPKRLNFGASKPRVKGRARAPIPPKTGRGDLFLIGGGANSPGGVPTYDFAKFSQKLHEIERIWTPGGRASKIFLCRSATVNDIWSIFDDFVTIQ